MHTLRRLALIVKVFTIIPICILISNSSKAALCRAGRGKAPPLVTDKEDISERVLAALGRLGIAKGRSPLAGPYRNG